MSCIGRRPRPYRKICMYPMIDNELWELHCFGHQLADYSIREMKK